eukprot:CAMPEP_0179186822 /NCGR_PEP_ID=MMETSP0796-20121207/92675_1 /TAXON_ID=73915 /ORGANISM="Pyrodinium bahamense, Strain pbaha01" /LENGTH=53 /DNA_ID=CAMNT_0020890839 /DNA_START=74 /DNA_END=232 /DNA_ORIENTATION=-
MGASFRQVEVANSEQHGSGHTVCCCEARSPAVNACTKKHNRDCLELLPSLTSP